jgi:predicted nucleotide-binding protein
VAGVSISQRLKSMLDASRFAFLVMTGDDKDDQGLLRARMNVIHEIGLFQGRLGSESAVVLRSREATTFSNLDGISRLDYEKGKLGDLKTEIHRLLIARGVMRADMGAGSEH